MNDLLRSLTKQAANQYLSTVASYTGTISTSGRDEIIAQAKELWISIIPDGFLEQYTELVIGECANVCRKNHRVDLVDDIRNHFGLTE